MRIVPGYEFFQGEAGIEPDILAMLLDLTDQGQERTPWLGGIANNCPVQTLNL